MSYTGDEGPRRGVTLDQARTAAEAMLAERNKLGATKSEVDFIAGAVAVMDFVFGRPDESTILPKWYIRGITGRKMLDA